jgi:hypothetical protein
MPHRRRASSKLNFAGPTKHGHSPRDARIQIIRIGFARLSNVAVRPICAPGHGVTATAASNVERPLGFTPSRNLAAFAVNSDATTALDRWLETTLFPYRVVDVETGSAAQR